MTREGEVRWTTYMVFEGREVEKGDGIQIGGPRSARGVVGNWFTCSLVALPSAP